MKNKIKAIAQQLMDLLGDEGSEHEDAESPDLESKANTGDKSMSDPEEDGAQVTPMSGMKNEVKGKEGATDGAKKQRTMKMMSAMLAGKIKHNQK